VFKQFFRSRHVAALPSADLYLNVGHTTLHDPAALHELETMGVERVVLIHDLIPVTHPEFCRPGDGDKHHDRVANTLRHASRIIVNSAYTGDELRAFASCEGLPQPPVHVAHLGLEPAFVAGEAVATTRPYFVHVGTIEARKNLAFLLALWRRLEERMGPDAPSLVLVGRYGWENEAVLDHLERSPNLRGLVHQASDVSDVLLTRLMRGARAVLAPSSVEGFDLPAVEARAMGVPLIASDIPPHRELTPDATLIDPLDGPGWIAAVELATRTAPKASTAYAAPDWPGHFDIVAQAIGLPAVSPLAGAPKGL
jgi:glycosyltransferase involved in cell wall biosynthesis